VPINLKYSKLSQLPLPALKHSALSKAAALHFRQSTGKHSHETPMIPSATRSSPEAEHLQHLHADAFQSIFRIDCTGWTVWLVPFGIFTEEQLRRYGNVVSAIMPG
jgi:hypothetical protein